MPVFPFSLLLFTLKPNVSFSNAHQSYKNITVIHYFTWCPKDWKIVVTYHKMIVHWKINRRKDSPAVHSIQREEKKKKSKSLWLLAQDVVQYMPSAGATTMKNTQLHLGLSTFLPKAVPWWTVSLVSEHQELTCSRAHTFSASCKWTSFYASDPLCGNV